MYLANQNRCSIYNGILFIALFALSSFYLAEIPWIVKTGISSLVIAIVLGVLYGNTLRYTLPESWTPGIHFSAKRLLRLAITLYGFRVSFQQIASVGIEGLLLDILVVGSTLLLGNVLGVKILKLDRHLALLISSGSAICGAAAVLAVEDVLNSESYKASIAVGTVVLFGTLGMFLYPLLQHAGVLGFTDTQFGIFAGASIHEVAQALITGSNVSATAGNIAVIVKMTRVLLLVPVLILLSGYKAYALTHEKQHKRNITIPWFAIGFVVIIGFNSLHLLPMFLIAVINKVDVLLLTMAMVAIGIETNIIKIKTVGLKPFYLAAILFIWLTTLVYLLIKFL